MIFADRRFLIFLGSAIFAWLTYVAYEVVLPVSIVDGYGYEPQAWGFLVGQPAARDAPAGAPLREPPRRSRRRRSWSWRCS